MNARSVIEAETPAGALKASRTGKPYLLVTGVIPPFEAKLFLYLNRHFSADFSLDQPDLSEEARAFVARYWEFMFMAMNEGMPDGTLHYLPPSGAPASFDPPDHETQMQWSEDDLTVGHWRLMGDLNKLTDDDMRPDE